MFDDVITSIKATLYERIQSPLAGAFLLSWCVWNWKVIYALLPIGDDPYYMHIYYVQNLGYGPLNLLVWPLISAVFLVAAFPFASWAAYKVHLWHEVRLKSLRSGSGIDVYISSERAAELLFQIRNLENQVQQAYLSKKGREQELEGQLALTREKLAETEKRVKEDTIQITRPETAIEEAIRVLQRNNAVADFEAFAGEAMTGNVLANGGGSIHLPLFTALGLVDRRVTKDSWDVLLVSDKGKRVLVELKSSDGSSLP